MYLTISLAVFMLAALALSFAIALRQQRQARPRTLETPKNK